jgi:hypothetical protein
MKFFPLRGFHRLFAAVGVLACLSTTALYGEQSSPGIHMIVQPNSIRIGSFFSGEKITVRAIIPHGYQAALRILGPREDLSLMRKGRVGGLWMNIQEVHFKNLPKVFLLWTSDRLSLMEKTGPDGPNSLDYLSVLSGALETKRRGEESLLVKELIKLKEADRLYHIFEGAIRIITLEPKGWDQVETVLDLPPKLYPGSYRLELWAGKEGKARLIQSGDLEVKLVGVAALISNLAEGKGLWYGILAVFFATFSGLLIGIVFSSKRGR